VVVAVDLVAAVYSPLAPSLFDYGNLRSRVGSGGRCIWLGVAAVYPCFSRQTPTGVSECGSSASQ